MSIELATTQPVRQPGTPPPPGAPRADELGLTLRERMWLARAAIATIVLSAGTSAVLISLLPDEVARPVSALQHQLADRASRPVPVERAPLILEPLAVGEIQRPAPAPEAPAVATEGPAPVAPPPEVAAVSKRPAQRRVAITRGRLSPTALPAAPAVDLSRPQPLAPQKPQHVETPEPVLEEAVHLASPAAELKTPSFE